MSIDTSTADIEALALARAERRSIDAAIAQRVKERAEIMKLHGVQEIGVDLIRRARDSARESA